MNAGSGTYRGQATGWLTTVGRLCVLLDYSMFFIAVIWIPPQMSHFSHLSNTLICLYL